jgi:hypothetical protein
MASTSSKGRPPAVEKFSQGSTHGPTLARPASGKPRLEKFSQDPPHGPTSTRLTSAQPTSPHEPKLAHLPSEIPPTKPSLATSHKDANAARLTKPLVSEIPDQSSEPMTDDEVDLMEVATTPVMTTPVRLQKHTGATKRPRVESPTPTTSGFRNIEIPKNIFQIPPRLQFASQRSTSSASKTAHGYLAEALQLVKAAQAIDPKFDYIITNLECAIQGKTTTLEQKVDQLLEITKAKANVSKAADRGTATTGTPKASLYSTIAKKGINASSGSTTATSHPQQKPKTTQAEERKLVLQIPDHKKEGLKIDSFTIRNQINKALGATVVAMITRSAKNNVVLTTTKEYSANYLLEKTTMWKHVFDGIGVESAEKPSTWIKLVVHGVSTLHFTDLSLLKEECKTFNPIEVIGNPVWLTKPEKRALQRAGSVVITVSSDAEKKHCLKQGLIIAGERRRVVNYKAYSPKTQCYRCQGYSHDPTTCRKALQCRLCAGNHNTREHKCATCNDSSLCSHVKAKCSNCSGNHTADSTECEIFRSVRL